MQTKNNLYKKHTQDRPYFRRYIKYQNRYSKKIRESDRWILSFLKSKLRQNKKLSILDVGCSTGNLLFHLRQRYPRHVYSGGDLSDLQLSHNRCAKHLRQIEFFKMDVLKFRPRKKYDVILCNAVLYGFSPPLFVRALKNISRSLHPGGVFLNFEFYHPWKQQLEIIEKSSDFPEGHPLYFRPISQVRAMTAGAGFSRSRFYPFRIPIPLVQPSYRNSSLRSYTVTGGKNRSIFRGALCQPWCFFVARKRK